MPGRMFSSNSYRYGLNGQEKDDEINGIEGAYTSAEFWEYDTRLGRRWNVDPMTYPWQSPYACFNNNPIYFADPSGLEGEPRKDPNNKHDDNNDGISTSNEGCEKEISKESGNITISFFDKEKLSTDATLRNAYYDQSNATQYNDDVYIFAVSNSYNSITEKTKEIKNAHPELKIPLIVVNGHSYVDVPAGNFLDFGVDIVSPADLNINSFRIALDEMGKALDKDTKIVLSGCGLGRVNNNGDNQFLGIFASHTGKQIYASQTLCKPSLIFSEFNLSMPPNNPKYYPINDPRFTYMYTNVGKWTLVTPIIGFSNSYIIKEIYSITIDSQGRIRSNSSALEKNQSTTNKLLPAPTIFLNGKRQ